MKKRLFPLTTGGGGGGGHQPTLIDKNISANGIYVAAGDLADGYSSVTVAVPEPILKTKSITENGSYDASGDGADGFSNVVVNVQTSQPDLISKSITQNGSYSASDDSADGYSAVTVAVPENFEKYHIVATEVGDVVNLAITDYVDQLTDNYYVGTINAEGMQYLYILTENGEPVVLIPKTISANGSYLPASDNANGYSSVTVAVPIPSPDLGTKTITANGTYAAQDDSLDGYSSVIVNIEGANDTKLKPLLDATKATAYLFFDYVGTSVDGLIAYSDTENVTNMGYMFRNCSSLTTVPAFDTSSVTTMTFMFYGCTNLTTTPAFDTENVTNMSYMFQNCSSLTTVPAFDTSSATNMSSMFQNCSSLTTVPAFNTSGVTNMNNMFSGCSNLEEIHMYGMKEKFNISASTKFTESALVEILNNLATVSTTKTLTMGATNLAKLTAEEIAIATDKGWTLA